MHKHINTNTDVIQVQRKNKSFTGNIYNKIPKTRRNHFLKCAKVSNIKQIQLLFPMAQPTQYIQLIHHIITEYLKKELEFFLMVLFYFRGPVAEKALAVRRELFGVTVNLLPHIELLIYTKPTSFLVGSTNAYGIIFYQVDLLPWLNYFWCCIWILDHLNIFIRICQSIL